MHISAGTGIYHPLPPHTYTHTVRRAVSAMGTWNLDVEVSWGQGDRRGKKDVD